MTPLSTRPVAKAGWSNTDTIDEATWMQTVIDFAERHAWKVMHLTDSRRSKAVGWPDVFAVRGGRAIAAELKTATGKLTCEQLTWLELLAAVPGIETHVWRPADWPEIQRVLR